MQRKNTQSNLKRQHTRLARKAGFTLLELLLVMAILLLLASVAVIGTQAMIKSAKVNTAKITLGSIQTAVDAYYLAVNEYPIDLIDLIYEPDDSEGDWAGPYLDGGEKAIDDPWSQAFYIESVGDDDQYYRIYSSGPDQTEGTDDDISYSNDPNYYEN
ncbi:MAG: type II secretion system protein GspG [Pirellulaceae bacterium]|nr:type II secretion system protein GspG [Pirellulaceae bacterium]